MRWGKFGTREITDETRVSQVREGTTTKAEVLGLFGKPDDVSKTTTPEHGSEEVWVYYYRKTDFPYGFRFAVLAITFPSGDDVVRRVFREEGRIDRSGPPLDRSR